MFEAGLTSVSFRELSPKDIISLMKQTGLKNIEWGSDIHCPPNDKDNLAKTAQMQAENGIKCCSYGSYFRLSDTPLDLLPNYISAAKALGTSIIRTWCGTKGSADYTQDEKTELFANCKSAAQIAMQNGVTLCMECHQYTFTDDKNAALELMQAVNSPNFRMYWQPNQDKTFEENMEYATFIAPYVTNIHVFNWVGESKYPLKLAQQTWQKYLTAFSGDHKLLLEFMPDGKPESLQEEATALMNIIGGAKPK